LRKLENLWLNWKPYNKFSIDWVIFPFLAVGNGTYTMYSIRQPRRKTWHGDLPRCLANKQWRGLDLRLDGWEEQHGMETCQDVSLVNNGGDLTCIRLIFSYKVIIWVNKVCQAIFCQDVSLINNGGDLICAWMDEIKSRCPLTFSYKVTIWMNKVCRVIFWQCKNRYEGWPRLGSCRECDDHLILAFQYSTKPSTIKFTRQWRKRVSIYDLKSIGLKYFALKVDLIWHLG